MNQLASIFIENPLIERILNHTLMTKFILLSITFIVFYLMTKLVNKIIRDTAIRRTLGNLRVLHITRLLNMGMTFLCLVVMCLLLGLGYSEISVFLSSIFAVVGIALFAQWSILSNVTASMIIFFSFPYQVGDRIRILDKDDDMTGIIEEITMFHVLLRCGDGNLLSYPNSLILQKAVLKIEHDLEDLDTEEIAAEDSLQNTNKKTEHMAQAPQVRLAAQD